MLNDIVCNDISHLIYQFVEYMYLADTHDSLVAELNSGPMIYLFSGQTQHEKVYKYFHMNRIDLMDFIFKCVTHDISDDICPIPFLHDHTTDYIIDYMLNYCFEIKHIGINSFHLNIDDNMVCTSPCVRYFAWIISAISNVLKYGE